MKLALKHAPPKGFWKRLFHEATKWRLVTRYPHGGIVIGDQLLHSNLSRGLHSETFLPEGWDLFDAHGDEDEVWLLFKRYEGTPYDWFGLLAFVLPWRVSDSSRIYCFKWQLMALTGRVSRDRVVAEDLLALVAPRAN